jgi:hypothetical protein
LDAVFGQGTEQRANRDPRHVVTCVLADVVGDFNQSMIPSQTRDPVAGTGKLTAAAYKRDARAAVVRLTRQRVASFTSSHDRDTDAATEVFTLEPSLGRGAPALARRRLGQDLPPISTRRPSSAAIG